VADCSTSSSTTSRAGCNFSKWTTCCGRARWELTSEGDWTRLTTTFDYTLPGGVLGKIAGSLIVRRLNAKSVEDGLQNFKALVERQ